MSSILCPKCKTPLEIPKPAPEKIVCTKCAASFRNASYKPSANGSAEGQVASPHVAQKLNGPARTGSSAGAAVAGAAAGAAVGAAAAGGTAQAVAEPRVAKNLAADAAKDPAGAPAPAPSANKAALYMGAGGAAAVLLMGVVVWAMLKGDGPSKKVDDGTPKLSDGTGDAPNLGNLAQGAGTQKEPRDPKVQESIDKGMVFLRKQIPAGGGGRPGAFSLIGLTLLECGAKTDDPDVKKIADMVRASAPAMQNPYDIAPAIFFLDRLYKDDSPTPEDKKVINSLGMRLVAGQRRPLHLWRYQVPPLTPQQEDMVKEQIEKKTFQGPFLNDQDMSCSQFAALGLWTAKRHGIEMPAEEGKRKDPFNPLAIGVDEGLARAALQARQQQNIAAGTWNYSVNPADGAFKDTSTCCGLILLCLGEAVKEKPQPFLQDVAVVNALKYLERRIKANSDPHKVHFDAHGNFYFLWALERTALILGLDRIGEEPNEKGEKGQDWHKWGTDIVLAQQTPGGFWNGGNGPVPDTCFALLFLLKANLFKDLSDKLVAMLDAPQGIHMAAAPQRRAPMPGMPRRI